MNANRRQFLQAAATTAATAATARAADPFAPADPGLTAQWFDKGKQHVLPVWAFNSSIQVPPTPKPYTTDTWERLSGGASHQSNLKPYAAADDPLPIGKVLHGTAAEWNGILIGGNKKLTDQGWVDAASAWDAMKARVTPNATSYGITNLLNWGMFAPEGKAPDEAGTNSLVRCYRIEMFEHHFKLRPDAAIPALLYTYGGMVPGPTFRFRHGMPAVVRFVNKLQTEVSIHHHGGHNPTHGDGFPSYYVLQGEARDYLYPNILPLRHASEVNGKQISEIDFGEGQSTTWYHDHGLDATAFNVSHGLSGFALWFDELELELIRRGVLPGLRGVSGNEITISKKEFEGWLGEWRKLNPDGELAREWRALMLASRIVDANTINNYLPTSANWEKDAQRIEAAAEHSVFKHFFHSREGDRLPGVGTPYFNPYDLPIVLQDRVIDQGTGQIVYDSNGHNGYIGNTQLINGVAWPRCIVKRRKYRLRLLDGSNARIYRLRFLDADTFGLRPNGNPNGEQEPPNIPAATLEARAMDFLRIGKDSWLWAMPQKMNSLILNMANRADLIVDFKDWYKAAADAGRLVPHPEKPGKLVAEYYLVNTMPQFDGRGPKTKLAEDAGDPAVFPLPFTLNAANPVVVEMVRQRVIPPGFLGAGPGGQIEELNQPIGLVKFIIEDDEGEGEDASIDETTILRPRHAIKDEEVMAVREFVFERGKGAWMINSRFYDPTISNANPVIGIKGQKFLEPDSTKPKAERKALESLTYAEEWILRNGGGGWWHPIHIHLEGHQLVGYEKDFEADGIVGADGILGAAAQAQMSGLPDWNALVGRFGFNPVLRRGTTQGTIIRRLRDVLMGVPLSTLVDQQDTLKSEIKDAPFDAVLTAAQVDQLNQNDWTPDPQNKDHLSAEFWFDSLSTAGANAVGAWLLGKLDPTAQNHPKQFFENELKSTPQISILIDRPGAGAALFPLIAKKLKAEIATLPTAAANVFRGLDALRLQWAGEMVGNHDTQALGPNTIARIRMRFRTWSGPLVFHCHNVEHEDMRMMVNFEATMSGKCSELNEHDPDTAPAARSHGQDVTDLLTNPTAVGEMPWEAMDGFPHFGWEENPVPGTPIDQAGDPLIKPREPSK